jgi:2-desacetyl-2-hydroxyethyl bacteriochlorophyllide A dehydrogenase
VDAVHAVRETPDGIAVVDVPEPSGAGVRVVVAASGICSSDLPGAAWPRSVTLGHEFSGHTDDGTPVAVLPNVPCGRCDQCGAGRPQLCRNLHATIHGFFRDGGMAESVVVDESCLSPLPAPVDVRDGCLVEPLAVALHTFHRAAAPPTTRVLVGGGGALGLASVAVARSPGHRVDLLARHQFQRAAGEALGAGGDAQAEYDVVVEAAGTQSALDAATERASPGGTIALAGMYGEGVTFGVALAMKEVSLVPAFTYGHHESRREFDVAVEMLAADAAIAEVMITHRFPLEDARRAFATAADRSAGAIKVVLEP